MSTGRPARPKAEAAQGGAGVGRGPAVARHRARTTTTTPSTGSRSRSRARSRASRSTAGSRWPTASTRAGKAVVWTGERERAELYWEQLVGLRAHDGAALAGGLSRWPRSIPGRSRPTPSGPLAIDRRRRRLRRGRANVRAARLADADLAALRRFADGPRADRDRPPLAARAHRAHLAPLGPPAPERDPGRLGAAAARARPDAGDDGGRGAARDGCGPSRHPRSPSPSGSPRGTSCTSPPSTATPSSTAGRSGSSTSPSSARASRSGGRSCRPAGCARTPGCSSSSPRSSPPRRSRFALALHPAALRLLRARAEALGALAARGSADRRDRDGHRAGRHPLRRLLDRVHAVARRG